MIRNSLPITIWEKHFTPFTGSEKVDVLKNNYDDIREYRNDVMHFHMLTYGRYKKIDLLLSAVNKELKELEYNMLKKWDVEATRKLVNDISNQELLVSLAKTVSKVVKPAMARFYVNDVNFNKALKSMMEAFYSIQAPKIDPEVLKSIQGIPDTMIHLDLPYTFNEPNSEEDDE